LIRRCMPALGKKHASVARYLAGALRDVATEPET